MLLTAARCLTGNVTSDSVYQDEALTCNKTATTAVRHLFSVATSNILGEAIGNKIT